MDQELPEAQWFILHTYSGYENLVKVNLETAFQKNNIEDRLIDIRIPMEDVVEEKNGKRKIVQRRMFPSYVLVKMIYNGHARSYGLCRSARQTYAAHRRRNSAHAARKGHR